MICTATARQARSRRSAPAEQPVHQPPVDAAFGGRLAEGGHRFDGEVVQHRIEKCCILALKQTDPSKIIV